MKTGGFLTRKLAARGLKTGIDEIGVKGEE